MSQPDNLSERQKVFLLDLYYYWEKSRPDILSDIFIFVYESVTEKLKFLYFLLERFLAVSYFISLIGK